MDIVILGLTSNLLVSTNTIINQLIRYTLHTGAIITCVFLTACMPGD